MKYILRILLLVFFVFLLLVLGIIGAYFVLPKEKFVENAAKAQLALYGMPLAWEVKQVGVEGMHAEHLRLGEPLLAQFSELSIVREGQSLHASLVQQDVKLEAELSLAHPMNGVQVTIPRVNFITGGTQPDTVVPMLSGMIRSVSGSLEGEGSIWYAKEEGMVLTNLEIVLRDIGASVFNNIIKGLNANIRFASLSPLKTLPQQEITIESVDAALPLADGKIVFSLDYPTLQIHSIDFLWGKGSLSSENLKVNLTDARELDFVFEVKNVLLKDIISLNETEFYSDAKVSGTIPVTLKDGKIIIKNGTLEAPVAGIIRYTPEQMGMVSNDYVKMVLDVLKDFYYKTLRVTLDSDDQGILRAHVELFGKNPEAYQGRPVELNIRLEGNIFDLLKSGMQAYNLQDNIVRGLGYETLQ
jgi:hypothetical protein